MAEAEYLPPDPAQEPVEGNDQLNEYGRVPSDVLLQTGYPFTATVTPYECDNCGAEILTVTKDGEAEEIPAACWRCNVALTGGVDDNF